MLRFGLLAIAGARQVVMIRRSLQRRSEGTGFLCARYSEVGDQGDGVRGGEAVEVVMKDHSVDEVQ